MTDAGYETRTFLDALFGAMPESSRILVWTLPSKLSTFCTSAEVASRVALARRDESDVYVGVGLRGRDHGPHERGGSNDVIGIPGFWADLDWGEVGHKKSKLPPDEAAVQQIIAELPLAPTLTIHSGYGLQPWWLFSEFYTFDSDEDRKRVENLSAGWQQRIREHHAAHGWEMDSTYDLARVLRVPGTFNRKRLPVEVRIVGDDGPLYAGPSEFEEHVATVPHMLAPSSNGKHPAPDLVLDPEADPPLAKLDALIENETKFARTWRRKRTDLADSSTSGYDMSLAMQAVSAGWTDQEIVNLCIAWHRKHGESLEKVLRYTYWRGNGANPGTLGKARSGRREQDVLAAVDVDEVAGEDDAEMKLAFLSRELGLSDVGMSVKRVIRRGGARDSVWHFLELADGTEIEFGRGIEMLTLRTARAAIYDATPATMSAMKEERWLALARLMGSVAEQDVIPESSHAAQFAEWVDSYVGGNSADRPEVYKTRVMGNKPFRKGGRVYLHAPSFRSWIAIERGASARELKQLYVWLRQARFRADHQSVWSGERDGEGRTITRYYWSGAEET